jgi:Flp pilus assembly protein TadD
MRWLLPAICLTVPTAALADPFGKGVSTPVTKTEQRLAMARLSERRGEGDKARAIYDQILKDGSPEAKAEAHHRLGIIDAKNGKPEPAANHFRQAVAASPENAEILSDIGYFNYVQGNFADAEQKLRKAVELSPKNPAYKNNLALVLGRAGRFQDSYQMFRAAGGEASAANNVGYLYAQQGKVDEAEKQYSRALTVNARLRPAAEGLVQIARHKENVAKMESGAAPAPVATKPRLQQPGEPLVVRKSVSRKVVVAAAEDAPVTDAEPAGGLVESSDQPTRESAIQPVSRRTRAAKLTPKSEANQSEPTETIVSPKSVLQQRAELESEDETQPVAVNTSTTVRPAKNEAITRKDGVRIVSDTPQSTPVVRIKETGEVISSDLPADGKVALAAASTSKKGAQVIPTTTKSAEKGSSGSSVEAAVHTTQENGSYFSPVPIEHILPLEKPESATPISVEPVSQGNGGRFIKRASAESTKDASEPATKADAKSPPSTKFDSSSRPIRKNSLANSQQRGSWNGRAPSGASAPNSETSNKRVQSWARQVIDKSHAADAE